MDDRLIYLKLHEAEEKLMVAMCDEDLIGKILEEGDLVIDLKAYSDFYKGELLSPAEARFRVDSSKVYSSNVVGEESVKAAIDLELIEKENVMIVKGVPFAQSFKMDK